MLKRDALHHYRQQSMEFSTPGEILVKLLDGAVLSCEQAKKHIEARDPAGKGVQLGRAISILGELEFTLRHDVAPELTARLAGLYRFARQRLLKGSLEMSTGPIDEALRAIRPIRDAYAQVVREQESKGQKG